MRAARIVASGALILLLGLALTEAGLQVASRLMSDRAGAWRPGSANRILCVGDSHTYGAQVEREESYPGQLQRIW